MSDVKSQPDVRNQSTDDSFPEEKMNEIVKRYHGKPGQLLLVLEDMQKANKYNFLSKDVLIHISNILEIPISKVFSVATFYSFFNLKPQGKHCITVCRGTACHTKKSRMLLENLVNMIGIKEELDEKEKVFLTSDNRQFTIRTIACFGQCALAPVCEVDGNVHAHMNSEKMRVLIEQIKKSDLAGVEMKKEAEN